MEYRHPDRFTMTKQHLALVSAIWVRWDDMGIGAPFVSYRDPYGPGLCASQVLHVVGENVDLQWREARADFHQVEPTARCQKRAQVLHKQVGTALQIVLATQSWEPGIYRRLDANGLQWERI